VSDTTMSKRNSEAGAQKKPYKSTTLNLERWFKATLFIA